MTSALSEMKRFTTEAAASLMATGKIVKGEDWNENAEIQAWYERLSVEFHEILTRIIHEYENAQITLDFFIEKKFFSETLPEEAREIESIIRCAFGNDVLLTYEEFVKRFTSVPDGTKVRGCFDILNALPPSKRAIVLYVNKVISITVDPYMLDPFYILLELGRRIVYSNFFIFHPVEFIDRNGESVGLKSCQPLTTGLRAWLQGNNWHDQYFNPAPEEAVTPETIPLNPAEGVPYAEQGIPVEPAMADSKDEITPQKKVKLTADTWKDEYCRLTAIARGKFNKKQSLHFSDEQIELLENKYGEKFRQLIAVLLHLEYRLKGTEVATIMNISTSKANDYIKGARN